MVGEAEAGAGAARAGQGVWARGDPVPPLGRPSGRLRSVERPCPRSRRRPARSRRWAGRRGAARGPPRAEGLRLPGGLPVCHTPAAPPGGCGGPCFVTEGFHRENRAQPARQRGQWALPRNRGGGKRVIAINLLLILSGAETRHETAGWRRRMFVFLWLPGYSSQS